MSDYRTMFVKDILPVIDRVAFDTMMSTRFPDCDPKSQEYNATVAVYNDGIATLRERLIEELTKEEEE